MTVSLQKAYKKSCRFLLFKFYFKFFLCVMLSSSCGSRDSGSKETVLFLSPSVLINEKNLHFLINIPVKANFHRDALSHCFCAPFSVLTHCQVCYMDYPLVQPIE